MKMEMDVLGNLVLTAKAKGKRAKARTSSLFIQGRFECDECHTLKYESGVNLCRERSALGMASLKVKQVCCKCVVLNQDKYIVDDKAPGLELAASAMKMELKCL